MPYFVILSSEEPPEHEYVDSWRQFKADHYAHDSKAEAYQAKQDGERVVYIATDRDKYAWRQRERNRFADGTYQRVPWHDADVDHPSDHFVHVSVNLQGMIAYTPDEESGFQDRQIRVKPGRYLEKFYKHVNLATRQTWISECVYREETLNIATSADDIETLYENAVGFRSCMGPKSHASFDYEHPTRVYGDSDLAVAYMGPLDAAKARCVIWPEKKYYSKVYGFERLRSLLETAGYRQGPMHGAKIRAIPCDDGWIMPYIDGVTCCENRGKYHVLGRGDISTDTTSGYSGAEPDTETCDHCGDDYDTIDLHGGYCENCNNMRHTCEHCDTTFFAGEDANQSSYCDSCEESRSYCECCESDTWEPMQNVYGESFSSACAECAKTHEDSVFHCAHCGEKTAEWEYDYSDQRRRSHEDKARILCIDCEDVIKCHACGTYYDGDTDVANPADPCPACGIVVRCEYTGDLLADIDVASDIPQLLERTA